MRVAAPLFTSNFSAGYLPFFVELSSFLDFFFMATSLLWAVEVNGIAVVPLASYTSEKRQCQE
jgi:hypothetical protein